MAPPPKPGRNSQDVEDRVVDRDRHCLRGRRRRDGLVHVGRRHPRVQVFATDMIRDHARLTGDLRQAALASRVQAPDSGMSSDEAALLSGLQSLRGVEFDKAYARQQVLAHTQAAAVEESFSDAGTDANLRRAAQAALPTIRDHLRKAQQLRAALDGS